MEGRTRLYPTARLQLLRDIFFAVRAAGTRKTPQSKALAAMHTIYRCASHRFPHVGGARVRSLAPPRSPRVHLTPLRSRGVAVAQEWQMRSHRLGLQLYPLFYPECFPAKAAAASSSSAAAVATEAGPSSAAAGPASSSAAAAATPAGELSEYERMRNDNILENQVRAGRVEPSCS